MNKDRLLSIREFSKLTGIKQSTLRYYDEVQLFTPAVRGKNGYRYYSAPQAISVILINVMNSLDVPLKRICEIKKERSPQLVLDLLRRQELTLNRELLRLQQAYAIIHAYSDLIQEGLQADESVISVQRFDDMPIMLGDENDFSGSFSHESLFRFIKQLPDRKTAAAHPIGGWYKDMPAFLSTPGYPTRFFSIMPMGTSLRKAGDYLVGYVRGAHGELGDLPERMKNYADEHELSFAGPVYELYLHGELTIADSGQFLIQASVPVKRQRKR